MEKLNLKMLKNEKQKRKDKRFGLGCALNQDIFKKNILSNFGLKIITMFLIVLNIVFKVNVQSEAIYYTYEIGNSTVGTYTFVADAETGEIDPTYTLSTFTLPSNGTIISADSAYNAVRQKYQDYIRYYQNEGKTIDDKTSKEYTSNLLTYLLELYLLYNDDGISAIQSSAVVAKENQIVFVDSAGNIVYWQVPDDSKKTYKDYILLYINDEKESTAINNPFFINDSGNISDSLVVDGKKINLIYTNEMIAKLINKYYDAKTPDTEWNFYFKRSEGTPQKTNFRILDGKVYLENGDEILTILEDGYEKFNCTNSAPTVIFKDNKLKYVESSKDRDRRGKINNVAIYAQGTYVGISNRMSQSVDVYHKENDNTLTYIGNCNLPNSKGIKIDFNINADSTNKYTVTYDNATQKLSIIGQSTNYGVELEFIEKFINDDKFFDFILPVIEGGTVYDDINLIAGSPIAMISSSNQIKKEDYRAEVDYFLSPLYQALISNDMELYLNIYKISNTNTPNWGNTSDTRLNITDFSRDVTQIPIKEILLANPDILELTKNYKEDKENKLTQFYNDTLIYDTDKSYVEIENYLVSLIRSLKDIILFLIFLFVIIIGVVGLVESRNPDSRTVMMQKYKNVLIGILLFGIAFALISIVINYTKENMDVFAGINDELAARALVIKEYSEEDSNYGFFIALIDVCLEVANYFMNLMNTIMAYELGQKNGVHLFDLIYNVRDREGNVLKCLPFDESNVEWTRCMSGYKALLCVSFAIMLIAIMKLSIEYIVFSTNSKKLEEVKSSFERMIKATLVIILAPFGVRLAIEFFNYMTSFIPVKYENANEAFEFQYGPLMNTFLNYMMISTKFRVYYVFLVRKLMISFLLVSTPIVAAIWAVSDKFNSMNYWIGELITNIALQFSYGLGFMLFIVMGYRGQSNEVGLILMIICLQLSKVIKDSLQGLFNEWGGINEEQISQQLYSKQEEGKNKIKTTVNKAGAAMEAAGKLADKDELSTVGVGIANAGKVLQGRFGDLRSTSDKAQTVMQDNYDRMHEERAKLVTEKGILDAEISKLPEDEQEKVKKAIKVLDTQGDKSPEYIDANAVIENYAGVKRAYNNVKEYDKQYKSVESDYELAFWKYNQLESNRKFKTTEDLRRSLMSRQLEASNRELDDYYDQNISTVRRIYNETEAEEYVGENTQKLQLMSNQYEIEEELASIENRSEKKLRSQGYTEKEAKVASKLDASGVIRALKSYTQKYKTINDALLADTQKLFGKEGIDSIGAALDNSVANLAQNIQTVAEKRGVPKEKIDEILATNMDIADDYQDEVEGSFNEGFDKENFTQKYKISTDR